jgi:hypothetical protein
MGWQCTRHSPRLDLQSNGVICFCCLVGLSFQTGHTFHSPASMQPPACQAIAFQFLLNASDGRSEDRLRNVVGFSFCSLRVRVSRRIYFILPPTPTYGLVHPNMPRAEKCEGKASARTSVRNSTNWERGHGRFAAQSV